MDQRRLVRVIAWNSVCRVAKIARDSYWRRYLERASAAQICDALIEGEKALCR